MGTITNPKLWTAETPNLYVLVVSLYRDLESAEKEQGAIDVETCRVGIRDVQFAGEGTQLNNLSLRFQFSCCWSTTPYTEYTL
jgi:beta-galactosidase/beta-glucuronidase